MFKRFEQLLKWADKADAHGVRANADLPDQAELAYAFGACGIGLCRTEHMFFGRDRIDAMREMILADNADAGRRRSTSCCRCSATTSTASSRRCTGCPVTIRTIDPPLHEFLPKTREQQVDLGGRSSASRRRRTHAARRAAPRVQPDARPRGVPPRHHLSGDHRDADAGDHRGRVPSCRRKGSRSSRNHDSARRPREGVRIRSSRSSTASRGREGERKVKIEYLVGTMIEMPRGALTADEIAETAEFFSFGTNDLTQLTFGFSRDDSGSSCSIYEEQEDPRRRTRSRRSIRAASASWSRSA